MKRTKGKGTIYYARNKSVPFWGVFWSINRRRYFLIAALPGKGGAINDAHHFGSRFVEEPV